MKVKKKKSYKHVQTSLISYTLKTSKFAIATTSNPPLRVTILFVECTTTQKVTKLR